MILFFTNDVRGQEACLSEEESRHATQVLRLKEGSPVFFVDGIGTLYEGILSKPIGKKSVVQIIRQTPNYKRRPFELHIAIAPTKNIDRFEWFLEKATEMGIDEITPLKCRRSERTTIRLDRLQGVLISALKQSLQAKAPVLNELTQFEDFINRTDRCDYSHRQKFIAYCNDDQITSLQGNYQKGNNVIILIGPEGDFTEEEVKKALDQRFMGISLGPNRLRTETAGVVACNLVHFINHH